VFIDWSDSLVTHPFLSLAPLFGFLDTVFEDPDSVKGLLVRAYLEEWRDFGSPADLYDAYKIASRLSWLNAALIMHRQVLPTLEIPSEFIGTEGLFLRFLLEEF
jgi:hypothetical protein